MARLLLYYINMKSELIAIPIFQERISPLLDVSSRFALFEIENGIIIQKIIISINAESEPLKVEKLRELGVSTVISSAVSGHVSRLISDRGLRLISWVTGPVDEIVELYIANGPLPCCAGYRGGCPRRGSGAGKGKKHARNRSGAKKREEEQ